MNLNEARSRGLLESPVQDRVIAETSVVTLHDAQKSDEKRRQELRAELEHSREEARTAKQEADAHAARKRAADPSSASPKSSASHPANWHAQSRRTRSAGSPRR